MKNLSTHLHNLYYLFLLLAIRCFLFHLNYCSEKISVSAHQCYGIIFVLKKRKKLLKKKDIKNIYIHFLFLLIYPISYLMPNSIFLFNYIQINIYIYGVIARDNKTQIQNNNSKYKCTTLGKTCFIL